jgi:hypothetical protein
VVESTIAAMVAAFGAAGHALADKRMTESDEERVKLERATETAKRLQKLRA